MKKVDRGFMNKTIKIIILIIIGVLMTGCGSKVFGPTAQIKGVFLVNEVVTFDVQINEVDGYYTTGLSVIIVDSADETIIELTHEDGISYGINKDLFAIGLDKEEEYIIQVYANFEDDDNIYINKLLAEFKFTTGIWEYAPNAEIKNVRVDTNLVQFDLLLEENENSIVNTLSVLLVDEFQNIITEFTPEDGITFGYNNDFTFIGLEKNTGYSIIVMVDYEDEYFVYEDTVLNEYSFTTETWDFAPTAEIKNILLNNDKVTFDVQINDNEHSIINGISIIIVDFLDNIIVEFTPEDGIEYDLNTELTVIALSKNEPYTIYVIAEYEDDFFYYSEVVLDEYNFTTLTWDNFPTFLNKPAPVVIEIGTKINLLDLGISAIDSEDGNITQHIDVNIDNTSLLDVGYYDVVYSVIDSYGNETNETIGLTVVDSKPVFNSIPENQIIEYKSDLDLFGLGLTAYDLIDGDITNQITLNTVDTTVLSIGKHTIVYSVFDSFGNKNSVYITITVIDSNPEFSNIPTNQIIEKNKDLDLSTLGLKSYDNVDGDLTSMITIDVVNFLNSTINYNTSNTLDLPVGEFNIIYTVTDSNKNTVTEIVRLSIVDSKPVLINIPTDLEIEFGTKVDLKNIGLEAIDEVDGDLTNLIKLNIYDTSTLEVGNHMIIYEVTDSYGNKTSTSINVRVHTPLLYFKFEIIEEGTEMKITNIRTERRVWIPNYIEGLPVTTIGSRVFPAANLLEVHLPNTLTAIENYAFRNNYISEIDLPSNVTYIGDQAFYGNRIQEVVIPENVRNVGYDMFDYDELTNIMVDPNNSYLKIVSDYLMSKDGTILYENLGTHFQARIPEGVISISDFAFFNDGIITVSFPSTLTSIGIQAFSKNYLATSFVRIPESVSEIGYSAFDYKSLSNFVIDPNNVYFKVEGDFLLSFDGTILYEYMSYSDVVVIPENITIIAEKAFIGDLIRSVSIPEGVTTIGRFAFSQNYLSIITIPSTIIYIGDYAFSSNNINVVIWPEISDHIIEMGIDVFDNN